MWMRPRDIIPLPPNHHLSGLLNSWLRHQKQNHNKIKRRRRFRSGALILNLFIIFFTSLCADYGKRLPLSLHEYIALLWATASTRRTKNGNNWEMPLARRRTVKKCDMLVHCKVQLSLTICKCNKTGEDDEEFPFTWRMSTNVQLHDLYEKSPRHVTVKCLHEMKTNATNLSPWWSR